MVCGNSYWVCSWIRVPGIQPGAPTRRNGPVAVTFPLA